MARKEHSAQDCTRHFTSLFVSLATRRRQPLHSYQYPHPSTCSPLYIMVLSHLHSIVFDQSPHPIHTLPLGYLPLLIVAFLLTTRFGLVDVFSNTVKPNELRPSQTVRYCSLKSSSLSRSTISLTQAPWPYTLARPPLYSRLFQPISIQNLRHHTVSASRNQGFTPSIKSSGDIMWRASRYGSAMIKTSQVVKHVRAKTALSMP
jgi:hypothetical protein